MVNEAYIRLAGPGAGPWENRVHFLSTASRAMRHILVDHARRRLAQKRGGGAAGVELADHHLVVDSRIQDIVELDRALDRLADLNERLTQVIELRFFGGLSEEETASVLGVNERTVRRDWRKARSFLHHELSNANRA
jgi:RNA polymerase sigma factor (TIGR02999 family)